jgi:membrane-associated phospholipid phosphatase
MNMAGKTPRKCDMLPPTRSSREIAARVAPPRNRRSPEGLRLGYRGAHCRRICGDGDQRQGTEIDAAKAALARAGRSTLPQLVSFSWYHCRIGLLLLVRSSPNEFNEVNKLRNWSIAAVATALAIVISAEFLDRPIARLSYRFFGHLMFARQFAGTPSLFGPLEIVVLSIFLFRRIVLYPLADADAVIALCEASLLITKLLLVPSKFVFGRTWPLYGHPSYLIDGSYGFNFFRAGPAFDAFPSGHTAAVCALAAVLWMTYPRLRLVYLAGAAAMAIALVAGDFHFLSDVLGGGFFGVSVAFLVLGAWNFGKKRFRELPRSEIFGRL